MNLLELLKTFKQYSETDHFNSSWTDDDLQYENDFISVKRLKSSNKWIGIPHTSDMDKMWSIIVDMKKDFTQLPNYKLLRKEIDMKITKVNSGAHEGFWGIRIYHMKEEPNRDIIRTILNFIFN